MTDQQISTLINVLRFTNQITPLQKDILDTWDELQKKPLDTDSAHKQITSNNFSHPDIFMAISSMPGVVQKTAADLTQDDTPVLNQGTYKVLCNGFYTQDSKLTAESD